jgi:altronate dehydratase small subunit
MWEEVVYLGKVYGILLNGKDNVATALSDAMAGDLIEFVNCTVSQEMKLEEAIPYGFKFAIQTIRKGEEVIKYGEIIGLATENIYKGSMVHVHNVEGQRARGDLIID